MDDFDDGLPQRQFDNFQFVDFHKVVSTSPPEYHGIKLEIVVMAKDTNFSLAALMEIPEQYQTIKKLGLLSRK